MLRTQFAAVRPDGRVVRPANQTGHRATFTCPGPHETGACSLAQLGMEPLCTGATWLARDSATDRWQIVLAPSLDPIAPRRCPLTDMYFWPHQRVRPPTREAHA